MASADQSNTTSDVTTQQATDNDEDFMEEPYPFESDLKSGTPVHYLTFLLKYFAPAEFIHDYNLKKMIECEVNEKINRMTAGVGAKEQTIFTGSTAEGLAVPEAMLRGKFTQVLTRDRDKMITVSNTYTMDLPLEFAQYMQGEMFEVENFEDGPSNYTYLKLTDRYRKASALSGKPITTKHIPSFQFREGSKDVWTKVTGQSKLMSIDIQGPAVTLTPTNPNIQDVEHVSAITFSEWPDCATKWMVRDRPSNWPDPAVRLEVVESGYHLVPVGRRNSPSVDLEWRYSFSVAEKILAQSMSKVQRQVYVILKLLQSNYFSDPSIFPSYCLKTLFLWVLEKVPQTHFQENYVGKLIFFLLDEICLTLSRTYLCHYFIEGVNLLKHTPRDHCITLLHKVKWLRNNLFECILKIEDKIEFMDLKRPKSRNLFYMLLSPYKKNPGDYELFLKSINDGLKELIESYLLLMKGYENFPDEYKIERETKWNLLSELCSQAALDLYNHSEVEFPSQVHFFIYTFAAYRNRNEVISKLILTVCQKVAMPKKIATGALADILEYCISVEDKVKVNNLKAIQKIMSTSEMPTKDIMDNSKLYARSFEPNILPFVLQNLKLK